MARELLLDSVASGDQRRQLLAARVSCSAHHATRNFFARLSQLIQERLDLNSELAAAGEKVDLSGLEQEFVDAAAAYSARKGISYAAWRELGVEPGVLKRAGIPRSS